MSDITTIDLTKTNIPRITKIPGLSYEYSFGWDETGYAVAGIDLNCNGREDIVISDPRATPGEPGMLYGGIIYVILDQSDVTAITNLTASIKIYGPTDGYIGDSLGVVKKFKGNCDALLIDSLYMLFGDPHFTDRYVDSLTAKEGIKISGSGGYAAAADAGYFFGTDTKDIIIGAPNVEQDGKAYIINGKALVQDIDLNNLDPAFFTEVWGAPIIKEFEGFRFGSAVAGGINFNGDEYDDVAIGYPGWNNDQGRVDIIFGNSNPQNITLTNGNSNTNISIYISDPSGITTLGRGEIGYSVSGVKNFNYDIPYDTVLVGTPGYGSCFAIWGTDTPQDIRLDFFTPDVGIKIQNLSFTDYCNYGLGFVVTGTMNIDKKSGYIVIANPCTEKAHVVLGGSNLQDINLDNATTYQGLTLQEIDYDAPGSSCPIAIVENFDGTGSSSVLIGSPDTRNDEGDQVGEAYFVSDVLALVPSPPPTTSIHPATSEPTISMLPTDPIIRHPTKEHPIEDHPTYVPIDEPYHTTAHPDASNTGNSGGTTIAVAASVVGVAIIGALGWYMCHHTHKIDNNYHALDT